MAKAISDLPTKVEDFDLNQFDKGDTEVIQYDAHDWDKDPCVFGKIIEIQDTTVNDDGVKKPVRYLIVENANGAVSVGQSQALKKFMDERQVGECVVITFTGFTALGGGKKRREFDAYSRKG